MYSNGSDGSGDSNNDVLSYEKKQSSSSELMTSY